MQPATLNAPEASSALRKQAAATAVPGGPGPARSTGCPEMYTLCALGFTKPVPCRWEGLGTNHPGYYLVVSLQNVI